MPDEKKITERPELWDGDPIASTPEELARRWGGEDKMKALFDRLAKGEAAPAEPETEIETTEDKFLPKRRR